ncbi:MAG: hypothetical protein CMH57_15565 [Myxococcales bacterium]|nr:hypothetical protein [Myxococcales bacterium]
MGTDNMSQMGKMMMNRTWTLLLSAAIAAIAAGCGGDGASDDAQQGTTDVCAEATQHLATCFEQEVEELPSGCDEAQASFILDASCDELSTSLGKADAWWCSPWTPPWVLGCGEAGGGGGGSINAPEVTINGYVGFAYEGFLGQGGSSISCALVVVTDSDGAEVARTHSERGGSFEVTEPLPAGDYTVTVYDRLGEGEENITYLAGYKQEPAIKTVTFNGSDTVRAAFELSYLRNGLDPDFNEGEKTEDLVQRCATVHHTFQVKDTCGQELAPYYDVRRDWVVTLTSKDGEVAHSTPLCQPADGDHWSWDGCGNGEPGSDVILNSFGHVLPGEYTIRFTRVDLPDRNNLDLEDELRWRTTEEIAESLSFSFEEAPDSLSLSLDALLDGPLVVTDPWADDCE